MLPDRAAEEVIRGFFRPTRAVQNGIFVLKALVVLVEVAVVRTGSKQPGENRAIEAELRRELPLGWDLQFLIAGRGPFCPVCL